MKIVECYCEDCRLEFKVNFKKSIPPWSISCPVCGYTGVKIRKINGD